MSGYATSASRGPNVTLKTCDIFASKGARMAAPSCIGFDRFQHNDSLYGSARCWLVPAQRMHRWPDPTIAVHRRVGGCAGSRVCC